MGQSASDSQRAKQTFCPSTGSPTNSQQAPSWAQSECSAQVVVHMVPSRSSSNAIVQHVPSPPQSEGASHASYQLPLEHPALRPTTKPPIKPITLRSRMRRLTRRGTRCSLGPTIHCIRSIVTPLTTHRPARTGCHVFAPRPVPVPRRIENRSSVVVELSGG